MIDLSAWILQINRNYCRHLLCIFLLISPSFIFLASGCIGLNDAKPTLHHPTFQPNSPLSEIDFRSLSLTSVNSLLVHPGIITITTQHCIIISLFDSLAHPCIAYAFAAIKSFAPSSLSLTYYPLPLSVADFPSFLSLCPVLFPHLYFKCNCK